MLEVRELAAHYGRSQALFSVSLDVKDGEAVAVLGANAAGKSTTLNCISRIQNYSGGQILFEGQDIKSWSPKRMVEAGVIQVPEGRQVFPFLTVLENLELGSICARARPHRKESLELVFDWLPSLQVRTKQLAGTLSGGEQQMLAIGRAMMARPRLLMLDEPSLGLSPLMVKWAFETIAKLKQTGISILLVEQNMEQALRVVDRAYVLNTGRTIMQATPAEMRADPEMRKAYLGIESVSEVVEQERSSTVAESRT